MYKYVSDTYSMKFRVDTGMAWKNEGSEYMCIPQMEFFKDMINPIISRKT